MKKPSGGPYKYRSLPRPSYSTFFNPSLRPPEHKAKSGRGYSRASAEAAATANRRVLTEHLAAAAATEPSTLPCYFRVSHHKRQKKSSSKSGCRTADRKTRISLVPFPTARPFLHTTNRKARRSQPLAREDLRVSRFFVSSSSSTLTLAGNRIVYASRKKAGECCRVYIRNR